MSPVIRIPENVYSRLEKHAKGFDTPANVIETLLNHYEGVDAETSINKNQIKKRDTTKYIFKNNQYGKGRLVLAVVKDYVANNPNVTYEGLLNIFPKDLQGSTGVFNKLEAVQKKFENKPHKRHFMSDVISLMDCNIVVSSEWGASNINSFIEQARENGLTIEPSNS